MRRSGRTATEGDVRIAQRAKARMGLAFMVRSAAGIDPYIRGR